MAEVIDNVKVGQFIRKLLLEKGMTQEQLANYLAITKSAVSQNLSGKSTFDLANLVKIAAFFSLSLDDLLAARKTNPSTSPSEYIKLIEQGLTELKKINPIDLEISRTDVFGKVLMDYLLDRNEKEFIDYILIKDVIFIPPYSPRFKKLMLDVIEFCLKHNLDHVLKLLRKMAVQFDGECLLESVEEQNKIIPYLDDIKRNKLLNQIMTSSSLVKYKFLNLVSASKQVKLISKSNWINYCARFKTMHILQELITNYDLELDQSDIITLFAKEDFLDGLRLVGEKVFEKSRLNFLDVWVEPVLFDLIDRNRLESLTLFISKHWYVQTTTLLLYSVTKNQRDSFNLLFEKLNGQFDLRKVALAILNQNLLPWFKQIENGLKPEDLSYLLDTFVWDQAHAPLLNHLIRIGGRFQLKNFNSNTLKKINHYLDEMNRKGS